MNATNSTSNTLIKWRMRVFAKCSVIHTKGNKMTNGAGHHKKYKNRIIHRADILHVYEYAQNHCCLRDYLLVRLPIKSGLRTNEICTLKAELVDFDSCHFQVLDSKKYRLYPLPLDVETVELIAKLLGDRREGYVFRHFTWTQVRAEKPLAKQAVWACVKRIGSEAGVEGLKPRDLRDFFAAYWHYVLHGSIVTLQHIMRHENAEMTWQYVNSMVFAEDIEDEYRQKMDGFLGHVNVCGDCLKSDVCRFRGGMGQDCKFKVKMEVQKV